MFRVSKTVSALAVGFMGGYWAHNLHQQERPKQSILKAAELLPTTAVPSPPPESALSLKPPVDLEAKTSSKTSQPISTTLMKFGFPGTDSVQYFDDFVLSYDRKHRTAHWVMEHLTAEGLKHNDGINRQLCEFHVDPRIHPYFRSENTDYKGSGFDRGHLAAAGNHRKCQQHCQETFVLSNMAPQVGKGFNRDSWNRLEQHVRRLTKKYANVYVCTGPLYLPRREADGKNYVRYQVIGTNNVAVPTHFFKVALCETDKREYDIEAYVMPNVVIDDNTPLSAFLVPIDTVERAAGLLFFTQIPKVRLLNGKNAKGALHPPLPYL